ncbi:MAG: DUF5615 family PIN-like protein [Tepidisphaeraceae bacterium]
MLRLLANENIPAAAVSELRSRGHDVLWARSGLPGASDEVVLARALAEQRVLITFDKDFGELVYRWGREASFGIVLFRFATASPLDAATKIAAGLESRSDWQGMFSVIEEHRIRMSALP